MATDLRDGPEASVTHLVSGIVGDMQNLMKQQFELLKHDVKDEVAKTRDAGLLLGVGAALGLVAAMLLMQALVYLTPWLLPDWPLWACFGLWGAVAALGGGGLIWTGINRLAAIRPLQEPGAVALKENVEWISHPR